MLNWPETKLFSLESFHDNLCKCSTSKEREAVLLNTLMLFGYDTYVFGAVGPHISGSMKELFFVSNMTKEWELEYSLEGYAEHDVFAIYCLNNSAPLLWSEQRKIMNQGLCAEDQVRIGQIADAEGYRVGVTLPLHISWNPHTFGISFCRKGSDDFDGHDKMFKNNKNALIVIARLFLTYFDLAEKFVEKFQLTKTQWRQLRMSFSISKQEDIALANNVEFSTVKKHWNNIFEKLGVKNQNEAQQLALTFGAVQNP